MLTEVLKYRTRLPLSDIGYHHRRRRCHLFGAISNGPVLEMGKQPKFRIRFGSWRNLGSGSVRSCWVRVLSHLYSVLDVSLSWDQGCVVEGRVQRYESRSVWVDLSAAASPLGNGWWPLGGGGSRQLLHEQSSRSSSPQGSERSTSRCQPWSDFRI